MIITWIPRIFWHPKALWFKVVCLFEVVWRRPLKSINSMYVLCMAAFCPQTGDRKRGVDVWCNLLALLVSSPASSPALPSGFFRAFCKLFNWLPAFWREEERDSSHSLSAESWVWHKKTKNNKDFIFTWKPLRATNSLRMSFVPSKILKILRSLITRSTPASCGNKGRLTTFHFYTAVQNIRQSRAERTTQNESRTHWTWRGILWWGSTFVWTNTARGLLTSITSYIYKFYISAPLLSFKYRIETFHICWIACVSLVHVLGCLDDLSWPEQKSNY